MTILLVAAEPREFRGLLRRADGVERLRWPVDWARAARLGERRFLLVAHGAGAARAAAAARAALERERPAAVVSAGFCGALDPALQPGDVYVATCVQAAARFAAPDSRSAGPGPSTTGPHFPTPDHAALRTAAPDLRGAGPGHAALRADPARVADPGPAAVDPRPPGHDRAASRAGAAPHSAAPVRFPALDPGAARPHPSGPLVSVDRVARTAAEKAALRASTGAGAVEMEAAGVAATARDAGLPFYCVRSVTDRAAESFLLDYNAILRVDGHFDTMLLLRGIARNPSAALPEVAGLWRRCRLAAMKLGDFIADCRF